MTLKRLVLILSIFTTFSAAAQSMTTLRLTAGAGYRQLVMDIAQYCKKAEQLNIEASFGNFGQMKAQITTTGEIEAVIAAKSFFIGHHVQVAQYDSIGRGTLVLAWRKGVALQQPVDLNNSAFKRIAIPNLTKALYGRAGKQYLQHQHLYQNIKNKLYVTSTVPQVSAYLVTGEVDAGFANLTDIQKVQDKIGGFMPLTSGYQPIQIVSAILPGFSQQEAVTRYRHCLSSDGVNEIIKRHGLR
ncbi:molybdate ABC transporter substrate-binding protein [Celerinatantimonas sp. MCCC 1A17872]|uniref:molybdate ABC transporter substrate-binding protein n=1 Tax=Celerinatantimonas sp. MCCC 1A17872 TaxID=3177514 RepID=UPI0038C957BF